MWKPRWSRRHWVASVFHLLLLATAATASAQQARRGPAYELKLDLDLPIVLVAGGVTSSFFLLPELPGVACAPSCDRSHINRLDRPAAGLYNPTWSTVGDIATATTLAAPVVVILVDEGLKDGLNDDLVVAEAALLSSALQISTSYAVPRPRPRVYADEAPSASRTNSNAARSFFSGHTANVVATSVAALRTFQRLGKPTLGWTMLGVGLAGSTVVGVSRVVSGAHFPSDVLIGAAVGAGFGLALPAVHRSGARLIPFTTPESAGLLLSGPLP
jgi:membrane-associated phospholipid phosphatase